MFRGRIRSIHFVGIGGIGMCGIAEVLLAHGFVVSGSDLAQSETTRRLAELGAHVTVGHRAEHVQAADVVVFSSAVKPDNPELVEANRRQIPVIPRAEMLAELMRLQDGIAIAGSHGKTTTTSLVATLLRAAELDPTVIIGGKLNVLGSSAARGHGEFLVAEADESDGSFLRLTPVVSVITNIDPEHLDFYGSLAAVKSAFADFANKVPFYGLVIACLDNPALQDILPQIEKRTTTYGFSTQADYSARQLQSVGLSSRFTLMHRGRADGDFEVSMPGVHNVQNALAVIAVADELGIDRKVTRQALATFGGVQRRFTVRGEARGITVVDDYGHHPTEVRATLEAAQRAYGRRVVVAFQPHRYTRTQLLFDELTRAFNAADVLFLTDVYAAGETPIPGADTEHLARAVAEHGHRAVHYVAKRADLVAAMLPLLAAGDVVITLGAGNITQTGPELLAALQTQGAGMARSRRPSHSAANERPQNRRTPKPVPKVSLRERFSSAFGWVGRRWDRITQGLWLLVRLALAAALAAGLVSGSRLVERYLHASPKFAIEHIDVQGNQRLTRDMIIDAAGLKVGQNVFDVGPDEVKRRLLELPWVESAEVHRRLPDKYQLQVRERRAAALLATPELQLVSEDGVVFKPLAAGDPYDLPVITGITAAQLNADKRAAAGALVSAVALLHDYQDAGLWRREVIAEIHVETDGSLSLYVGKDPTQVRLGKPPFRQKLERLREVLTMLSSQQTRASYVLLDNQRRLDRVTVRLR